MKLLAWNLALGLSDSNRCSSIIKRLLRAQPDVAVLSEAFGEYIAVDFPFEKYGYAFSSVPYNDELVGHQVHLGIMCRIDLNVSFTTRFLDHRNGVVMLLTIDGRPIQIVGLHLDDKREEYRLSMLTALRPLLDLTIPTIMLGDLNAIHFHDLMAQALRSKLIRWLAPRLPHWRLRSLGTRLVGMADGRTLSELSNWGFYDADKKHRPTMKFLCLALVQLDHILYTIGIRVLNMRVLYSLLSDHNAVTATIEFSNESLEYANS